MYDECPTQFGRLPNGCPERVVDPPVTNPPPNPNPGAPTTPTPTPTPTLQIYLKVDVTKAKAAKVRVSVSRKAKVSLKIERKSGRKWKRVTATRSVTASMSVKSVTLRPVGAKRFPKGSYRVTATVGRQFTRKPFTVK